MWERRASGCGLAGDGRAHASLSWPRPCVCARDASKSSPRRGTSSRKHSTTEFARSSGASGGRRDGHLEVCRYRHDSAAKTFFCHRVTDLNRRSRRHGGAWRAEGTPSLTGGHGSAARRARLCLRAPAQHLLRTSSATALPCGGGRSSCTWPSHGSSFSCVNKGPWCKLPSAGGAPWLPLPCACMEQR